MSVRSAALLLFVGAFLTVPLPMVGLAGSLVPAARYLQLAGVMVGLVLHEGTGGMVAMLVWLFVGHALVYSLLIWGGAALLARTLLLRLDARGRRSLVIVTTILLLVGGSVAPLYRTQFHHGSARARLLELYR